AGHSRVPAPPHMISGMMRLFIGASNLVVVAIPRDKITDAVLDRGFGSKAHVAHQIPDIREGFQYIARLHRQHFLCRRAAQLILQERDDMHELLGTVIADIVDPGRRIGGSRVVGRNTVNKLRYHTGDVTDMREVPAHLSMDKELCQLTAYASRCETRNAHILAKP